MGWFSDLRAGFAELIDRIDKKIDKPAKDSGTFLQGSEQMIDDEMAREKGRAVANKRSGFGRGI